MALIIQQIQNVAHIFFCVCMIAEIWSFHTRDILLLSAVNLYNLNAKSFAVLGLLIM